MQRMPKKKENGKRRRVKERESVFTYFTEKILSFPGELRGYFSLSVTFFVLRGMKRD